MRRVNWPSSYISVAPRQEPDSPSTSNNSHNTDRRKALNEWDVSRKWHRNPNNRGNYKRTLRDHRR